MTTTAESRTERIEAQLKGIPAKPGVYLFRGAEGRRPLRGQGEVPALARALVLPRR